jgi:hypothetical protein
VTALAGVPGVDRAWTTDDVRDRLLVVVRDGQAPEVAQAPDRIVVRAAWVTGHVAAGICAVVRPDGARPVLVVGSPASRSGRVVYVLSADPATAPTYAKLEGTRLA